MSATKVPHARASQVIESGIARGLHIGAQLYVSHDGKRIADLAFGLAREGVAMTPDTIMMWMSSTKPITVVAVAQIWERGKIALDDPVAKYIPEFANRRFPHRGRAVDSGSMRPDHRASLRRGN